MKKNILVLAASIGHFLTAQITLTNESHSPQSGESYTITLNTYESEELPEIGEEITWDYSTYTHSIDTTNVFISNGYFWRPNWVFHSFQSDTSGLRLTTIDTPAYDVRYYGREVLFFPMTYGDSKTSPYSGILIQGGPKNDDREPFSGEFTISAVAYGDLILPHVTYSNVLLVKTEVVRELGENIWGDIAVARTFSYDWYHKDLAYPVATYSNTHPVTKSDVVPRRSTLHYITDDLDIVEELVEEELEEETIRQDLIFPNPAESHINILSKDDAHQVEIYDMHGILVKVEDITHTKKIDISELSRGVYIVRLISDKNVYTEKFFLK